MSIFEQKLSWYVSRGVMQRGSAGTKKALKGCLPVVISLIWNVLSTFPRFLMNGTKVAFAYGVTLVETPYVWRSL